MPELINGGDPSREDCPTDPAVGEPVPDFAEVRGTRQALILFHGSASW